MKKYLTLKNLGWLFTAIVVLMIGMSGISKLIPTDEMIKNFEFMKLTPYMGLIGFLEVLGVGLLVYPKTSIYGALLTSCTMSGAISIHLSLMAGVGTIVPFLLGALAWTAHCLRHYTN